MKNTLKTCLENLSSNEKKPKIVPTSIHLIDVKSFVITKKEKDFWKNFPYSYLSLVTGTLEERAFIQEKGREYFNIYSNQLMDLLEGKVKGTLKEIKKLFYCLQWCSYISISPKSYYDPLVSYINARRAGVNTLSLEEQAFIKGFNQRQLDLLNMLINSKVVKFTIL